VVFYGFGVIISVLCWGVGVVVGLCGWDVCFWIYGGDVVVVCCGLVFLGIWDWFVGCMSWFVVYFYRCGVGVGGGFLLLSLGGGGGWWCGWGYLVWVY
jgi:hypothetical protein